jgi:peptidyl-prolyl cis-trans isomerase B (cyclophilin B)
VVTSEHERRLEALRRQRQGLRLAADRRRRRRREQLFAATALLGVTAVIAVLAPRMLAGDAVAPAPAASPTSPAALVGVCSYALDGTASPQVTGRPPARSTTTARTATLLTSRGRIVLRLLPEQAPCAVRSFAFLAARGYYDGSHCPRLTTGPLHFVECGEPPRGPGPGYAFASEALEGARYPRGTVGLANNGPGTSGGRFFLVYGDSPLPPSFTPFAVVTAGLDVLDGVAAGGARPERDGRPLVPLTLSSVRTAPR